MQGNDLATWSQQRIIVVLEGAVCHPHTTGRVRKRLAPVTAWNWQVMALKSIVDHASRLNTPVEVVTFISQEVADAAAEWFAKFDTPIASMDYVEYDWFCRSLTWRPDVASVIDSDLDRAQYYGQRGVLTTYGTAF